MGRDIAIVEDGHLFLRALSETLESYGYTPHPFFSRLDALRVLDQVEFHAILTDYIDPGPVNLEEFVHKVRRTVLNQITPIIVMTALPSIASHLADADIQGSIEKPFHPDVLHRLLQTVRPPTS